MCSSRRPRNARLAVLALLLFLAPARAWAAAALVQSTVASSIGGGTTSGNISFGGNVVAGNAIVAVFSVFDAGLNYTFSGCSGESFSAIQTGGFLSVIFAKLNSAGGCTQINFTVSGAGTGGHLSIFEVSGLDNGASVQTGFRDASSDTTSHTCSASGLSATGFAVAVARHNATSGTVTAATNYTLVTNSDGSTQSMHQRGINTFSSNLATWSTVNAVSSWCAMAIFPEAAGGGGGGGSQKLRMMGVR